jgi:hypothetical protein
MVWISASFSGRGPEAMPGVRVGLRYDWNGFLLQEMAEGRESALPRAEDMKNRGVTLGASSTSNEAVLRALVDIIIDNYRKTCADPNVDGFQRGKALSGTAFEDHVGSLRARLMGKGQRTITILQNRVYRNSWGDFAAYVCVDGRMWYVERGEQWRVRAFVERLMRAGGSGGRKGTPRGAVREGTVPDRTTADD